MSTLNTDISTRLDARRQDHRAARHQERRAAIAGLVVLVLAVAALSMSADGILPLHWTATLGLCVLSLIVAIQRRERCTVARRRLGHAVQFWEHALARSEDRWSDATQDDGAAYSDPDHPYANDLDLFGPHSLFSRINTTQTTLGRDALARLLTDPDEAHDTAARQEAVRDIAAAADMRETLHVELQEFLGDVAHGPVAREILDDKTRSLSGWGREPTPDPDPTWRVLLDLGLAALFLGAVAAAILGHLPWSALAPFWLLNYVFLGRASDVDEVLERFESVRNTLGGWSRILRCVEDGLPASAPPLRDARRALEIEGRRASDAVADLDRRVERLAWRGNMFWALTFDVALLWDLHARRALYAWKRRFGDRIDTWLQAAAQVEAHAALGSYAAAVPDHVFPETCTDAVLAAEDLAHPLLPSGTRVGNDLHLDRLGGILLITGSNMSGKSTFLRAVGLATVMARCGLPIPARSFRLRPLHVVTCMRIQDDLARGSSLFHAEVQRLADCVERAQSGDGTLVLLDEILAGTNSLERHVGTEGVLRGMINAPAATMVATHDLELAKLIDEVPDRGRVLHFRDAVEAGQMTFDYRLREGPCPSTNALRVMRDAGLDVDRDGA